MFVLRSRAVSLPAICAAFMTMSALAGCQTTDTTSSTFDAPGDPTVTGTVNAEDKTVENTQKWARYWQKNPKDVEAAISYAVHLKALKKHEEALGVLRKTVISNPENAKLLTAYGKQLLVVGQLVEAGKVLDKATRAPSPTWEAYSLHGTVLDRLAKHEQARTQYKSALQLAPNNASVMNNMAMSHAMSGDPKTAETILIDAIAKNPDKGHGQLQQNLALVVALQGDFDRAREVLAKILPAHQVEANMTYIKKMISQPNTWKRIQSSKS